MNDSISAIIDGEPVTASGPPIAVVDPSNEEVIAEIAPSPDRHLVAGSFGGDLCCGLPGFPVAQLAHGFFARGFIGFSFYLLLEPLHAVLDLHEPAR